MEVGKTTCVSGVSRPPDGVTHDHGLTDGYQYAVTIPPGCAHHRALASDDSEE